MLDEKVCLSCVPRSRVQAHRVLALQGSHAAVVTAFARTGRQRKAHQNIVHPLLAAPRHPSKVPSPLTRAGAAAGLRRRQRRRRPTPQRRSRPSQAHRAARESTGARQAPLSTQGALLVGHCGARVSGNACVRWRWVAAAACPGAGGAGMLPHLDMLLRYSPSFPVPDESAAVPPSCSSRTRRSTGRAACGRPAANALTSASERAASQTDTGPISPCHAYQISPQRQAPMCSSASLRRSGGRFGVTSASTPSLYSVSVCARRFSNRDHGEADRPSSR